MIGGPKELMKNAIEEVKSGRLNYESHFCHNIQNRKMARVAFPGCDVDTSLPVILEMAYFVVNDYTPRR